MRLSLTRRGFLAGTAVAGFWASGYKFAKAFEAPSLPYKRAKIANIKELKDHSPITFNYPDSESIAILVKLGKPAIGGIGPKKDIVAFSAHCTHQGCPVNYSKGRLICKCHYSMFDPAKNGQVYQGHASQWLPQITLSVDSQGNIYAAGIEGLIWGRAINLISRS